MKKLLLLAVLVAGLFIAPNAFADPTFTVLWDVSSLKDDAGSEIIGLALDLELGNQFVGANGMLVFEDGVAAAVGTALLDLEVITIEMQVQKYFLFVTFSTVNFSGDIYLYGPDGKQIDSGKITFKGTS